MRGGDFLVCFGLADDLDAACLVKGVAFLVLCKLGFLDGFFVVVVDFLGVATKRLAGTFLVFLAVTLDCLARVLDVEPPRTDLVALAIREVERGARGICISIQNCWWLVF